MASPHRPGKELKAPEEAFAPVVTRPIAGEHCSFRDLTIYLVILGSLSLSISALPAKFRDWIPLILRSLADSGEEPFSFLTKADTCLI